MEQNKSFSPAAKTHGRWKLLAVIAVCAAPLVASYVTYYVIKPQARTNFGALIDPRDHPIPALGITTLDGKSTSLAAFKGKWIMLQVGPSNCQATCHDELVAMRQQRLMQGKEMERLERVWLITDAAPLDTTVMREFDGTRMLRVDAAAVAKWLPVDAGGDAADHLYLVDPLGNLMMRFPKGAEATIEARAKVKKDIGKLLAASAIG